MRNYKALLLASDIRNYTIKYGERVAVRMNNNNSFVDRLKQISSGEINNIVMVAATPSNVERNREYARLLQESMNLDGFNVENVTVIDDSFVGDLDETILSADMVYLSRGHAPTQNLFYDHIGLKGILENYQGIILAQGSGMINCSDDIYFQPRNQLEMAIFRQEEDGTPREMRGLGLIKFSVIPHLNTANTRVISGCESAYAKSTVDSYIYPHCSLADGAFIELDGDSSAVTVYGHLRKFKNGKSWDICKDGQKLIISQNTDEKVL